MYAYGIRGNVFKLLKSYLTNRTQSFVYDGIPSYTFQINCGVPQGSVLGPLLFIIYMNDVKNVSDFLYTILYADDTSVLLSGKDYITLVKLLTLELDKFFVRLKAYKLSLNVQKTYYMILHRTKIKIDKHPVVTMDNMCLNKIESLKYLGMIIDHKLN